MTYRSLFVVARGAWCSPARHQAAGSGGEITRQPGCAAAEEGEASTLL